jgi:predicted DNA-binding transcriptional regulator YafY
MRHSFKVMHDELYTVKVRISPGWARWVGEKIWHESQKVTRLADGGLEVAFRVADLDEIKRLVLSFGPEAEVLEPVKIRKIIRNDLYGMLEQYQARRIGINLMKEIQAV